MAVLKGSEFLTLGLYSCPKTSKLHDDCMSYFQICPSGCLLHSGRLLFLVKSDLLVGNSIRSVIRYWRVPGFIGVWLYAMHKLLLHRNIHLKKLRNCENKISFFGNLLAWGGNYSETNDVMLQKIYTGVCTTAQFYFGMHEPMPNFCQVIAQKQCSTLCVCYMQESANMFLIFPIIPAHLN